MQGIGFLELMASEHDPTRWHELSAGMICVRCAEAALGPSGVTAQELRFARTLLPRVPNIPRQLRLASILETIDGSSMDGPHRSELARKLLSLGIELQADGHLSAAVDVFRAIVIAMHDDADVRLLAYRQKGFALRTMKQFEEASIAYGSMHELATRERNRTMQLEAMLGHAKIDIERGNLPAAEDVVKMVLERARRLNLSDVVARALMDRAAIAGIRRDPINAILDTYEALELAAEPTRERLLMNLATAYREVEHAAAARQIAEHLLAQSPSTELRAYAAILAYHLEIDAGDDLAMERARRRVVALERTPLADAEFEEAYARELSLKGRFQDAIAAAERMLECAQAHRMNELVIRADVAIADLNAGRVPAVYQFRPQLAQTAANSKLAAVTKALLTRCAVL